jgi:hypothetical protein
VLDERGKEYSTVGDSDVNDAVSDLVRGQLCTAIVNILNHVRMQPIPNAVRA